MLRVYIQEYPLIIPILLSPSSAAILVTLWIGLVAYLLGDGFLDRWGLFRKMPSLDRLALSLVSGYGILMLLSTFLGFFGLYYPASAWIILALPTILLLPFKNCPSLA